jgi:hypothetical protein
LDHEGAKRREGREARRIAYGSSCPSCFAFFVLLRGFVVQIFIRHGAARGMRTCPENGRRQPERGLDHEGAKRREGREARRIAYGSSCPSCFAFFVLLRGFVVQIFIRRGAARGLDHEGAKRREGREARRIAYGSSCPSCFAFFVLLRGFVVQIFIRRGAARGMRTSLVIRRNETCIVDPLLRTFQLEMLRCDSPQRNLYRRPAQPLP